MGYKFVRIYDSIIIYCSRISCPSKLLNSSYRYIIRVCLLCIIYVDPIYNNNALQQEPYDNFVIICNFYTHTICTFVYLQPFYSGAHRPRRRTPPSVKKTQQKYKIYYTTIVRRVVYYISGVIVV